MKREITEAAPGNSGWTGWLISRVADRFRRGLRNQPRLALVERIALAPRQSLALVEVEGRRFLVATSSDGSPAFYPLDERSRPVGSKATGTPRAAARVSW
jgi:flagellar biogenesis protein FliO